MKIMKNITVVLLGVLLLTMLSGCGGSETEPINVANVAFVLGIADDETKVNDGISELEALPTLAGSTYAFISAEGQPTTIGEPGEIPDFSQKGYTKDMMNRVYASIKADLTQRLETYQPSTAEIDMAAATELAVRNLNAHAIEGRRNVLVYYCSGRSTTGLINMTETGLDDLDIEASVAAIAKQMDADMSKVDEIICYCFGDCGPKQGSLCAEEKVTMKTFYEELFHALGASTVTFRDDLPSTEAYSFSDTPVSAIPVKDTVSGLSAEPIVLSESKLEFLADSAEFKDTDAAEAALQPVADMLLKDHDLRVLVYSTCAGDIDYPELSSKRSETVKNCLMAKGVVEESRIVVVNVKVANDPYYKLGLGTGPEASVNRKTVIVDLSSEFGRRQLLLAQQ